MDMGFSAAQAEAALNHFPNRGVSVTGVSVLEKPGCPGWKMSKRDGVVKWMDSNGDVRINGLLKTSENKWNILGWNLL